MKNSNKNLSSLPILKFNENKEFERELHSRVNKYFDANKQNRFATTDVYLKGFFVIATFISTYILLVFFVDGIWEGIIVSILMGFALVGIGVNLQHDGSHNAYSEHRWLNRGIAMTADFIGASSYFWRWKHNRIHHPFTNVFHFDTDIDFGILGRVAPAADRYWFHRWQHLYIWVFYGFLVMKWQLFDDFYSMVRARLGNHRISRPTGFDLIVFIVGKSLFFSYAFIIPLTLHPVGHVIFFYFLTTFIAGLTLSLIFVLPHCCGDSEFPEPNKDTGQIENPRAIHQVRVTVDFMRNNPVVTWLVGGLNYHREHHLFPGVCHVHYSKIAALIDDLCVEFGIPHKEHRSYAAGIASHYRWLRRMGT